MALDLSVETIDVDVRENEADVSCIDITEDDDVVCIGSESSEVLRLRTVNRRVEPAFQPLSNTDQFPQLIGSGETVNSLGSTLNSLPLPPVVAPVEKIVGKIIKCSVCLEDVNSIESKGDRKLISTNCGHIFCETCIKETIRNTKSCPTCRKKLTQKSYHPIFL
ncbi:E3 ubiquitin-protein ligase RNF4-like isoform X1 [Leptotrombidium deliense]|uniref:E3 ubiquitin-protein ligase RNF4-like isoform X1 n=1 Tax=Leptotrombidium deliense TaxID=299467 RepID=A0A443SQX3_9ACAR|nr:E3 ubiquitin-protein ligase RNF4-like isoform X1 [Leptotrombidium deliense]